MPVALLDAKGKRIASTQALNAASDDAGVIPRDGVAGRRPGHGDGARPTPAPQVDDLVRAQRRSWLPFVAEPTWPRPRPRFGGGGALLTVLVLLFVGVALGAFPVVRRLTRRLETATARGGTVRGRNSWNHQVDETGKG